MADKEEVHPVVKLLLARMESHPEEFTDNSEGRWEYALDIVEDYGSVEDKAAIDSILRVIHMEEAHKWMMDELLYGESRRAEAKRELEELEVQVARRQYTQSRPTMVGAQQRAITRNLSWDVGDETLDAGTIRKIRDELGI